MKVFITGATGFIGSHLAAKLSRQNDVTCYVRKTSNLNALQGLNVRLDYTLAGIEKSEVVYHIAGILGAKGITEKTYFEVNASLTDTIVGKMSGQQKLIYLSTGWAGKSDHPYERSKLAAEFSVSEGKAEHCIIRPGWIYGPGDKHHLPLFRIINTFGMFTPIIGNGQNRQSPTHIYDLLKLFEQGLTSKGIIYGCSQVITTEELIGKIAKALGKSKPSMHLSSIPTKTLRDMARWNFFTGDRPNEPIADSISLSYGIPQTVTWYKMNGWL